MTGRTLGHYEVLEALGAGGMGEVYRARDTKLERDVAIKVLPEKVAGDAELLARFEREARLLASLNHANIAHIYGLEHEGGEQFIVMEVVEGETLEERIKRVGRLDPEDAVDIARQIAVGLEAAHDSGVVHRDLKPANVKITAGGDVKILDFGLATNSWVEGEGDSDASNSPTMLAATGAGIIMGTAAYMSPEQAKGQRVDRRTDIWAFGVVLYEMLSGAKLFEAETVSEVLADVLRAPIDLQALPADTPLRLRRLLERCLDRNPRTRLRDIGEARVLLADAALLRDGAETSAAVVGQGMGVPSPIAATGMLVVAAILIAATAWITRSTMPTPPQRVARVLDISVDAAPGPGTALSPDGSKLAYWRRGADLVVQDLTTGASTTIFSREDPTGGYGRPYWSPDGRDLVVSSGGVVLAVAASGGDVRVVAEAGRGSDASLAGWGPGGVVLLSESGIEMVSAAGGNRSVLIPSGEAWASATPPAFLDNGDALFLVRGPDTGATLLYLWSGGSATLLRELPFETQFPRVHYGGGDWLVIDAGDRSEPALWALPFDPRRRVSEGDPVRVIPGGRSPTMSDEGALVYVDADALHSEYEVVWVNRQGVMLETVRPADELIPTGTPAVSPDGRRMAIVMGGSGPFERRAAGDDEERELLVYEFATPGAPVLLDTAADIELVGWLPDSRHVVITRRQDEVLAIEALAIDGGDDPRRLADARGGRAGRFGFGGRMRPTLAAGGGLLTYVDPEGRVQMISIDAELNASQPELLGGDRLEGFGTLAVAPNGDLAAVVSGGPGQNALSLMPLPAAAPTFPVSEAARSPRFSADGSELFFNQLTAATTSHIMTVAVDPVAGRPTGPPQQLFATTIAPRRFLLPNFDVAPDGQRFLMVLTTQPPTRHVLIEDFDAYMAARTR